MRVYIIITSLLLGICVTSALGQTSREVYPEQAQIQHNQAVKSFSKDYISAFERQSDPLNVYDFGGITGNIHVRGLENITSLLQQGYNIGGLLNVSGDNNKANMQQVGHNLFSSINLIGSENQLNMIQHGDNLLNHLQVFGSDSHINAFQTNTGMNIQQNGPGIIPLQIQQVGNPSPIIIRNH